jgi:hypothetical protein
MNFAYERLRILAFIAMTMTAAGCAKNGAGPETVPVTGKVMLDGVPIAQAVVSLTPAADAAGSVPAQATTNESGEFEVYSAFDQGRTTQAGMVPGDYAVTVTKLESIPAQAQLTRAPKNLLPKQYESAASSGLTATITADGENFIAVDLKK